MNKKNKNKINKNKIKLPFNEELINETMNEKQIGAKIINSKGFIYLIKKILMYKNNGNNINNSDNKIKYIKATESKKYYDSLNKK